MANWIGLGGGRNPSQPSLDLNSGAGMGSGRAGSQPSLDLNSGAGMGSGRGGSQPTISEPTQWVASPASNIQESSNLGARSTASTGAMTDGGSGNAALYEHVGDPEGAYVFALEIDGIEVAQFLECSGLKSSTEIFEIQEGGLNSRIHKLPGQSTWDNISLRYGVTNDVSMLEWRSLILLDEFEDGGGNDGHRRNGAIVVKNNQMEVVRRYEFLEAWPVSWEGPSFTADSSDLAIETMELAHHGLYVS